MSLVQITVIGCVSATGQAIPPFVIFDAKCLNMDWRKGEIPGTTYGLSDKGWVDTELFKGGSLITCSSMQLGLDRYLFCWMVTAHTINLI